MYLYLNGEIVTRENARISPFDHGFLYGMGVFETFRIYDGHPFLLDDHLVRLQDGLNELKIKKSVDRAQVMEIINNLLSANGLKQAYVRLNVSAGTGDVGLPTGEYEVPTVLVFMKDIPAVLEEKQANFLQTARNTPEGDIRLKSHHFLNNIYGKREIGNNPNVEGIFLTKEGYLAEGITSNLFWVTGDRLFTPAVQTGILNGVTRNFVIQLAKSIGLNVQEGFYHAEDLLGSDEAFITNSIQEIVPLTDIENHTLRGKKGPVTKKLQYIYSKYRKNLWSKNEITKGI
ncbi:aminodeoxychorismate lyase [Bacillus sp. REN16]|uniref:aminodeoxychorismate lyase n=1 Tax=Bacillus sp. REN16 TaxID=2887296 RepID=UPI001E4AF15A|nr:aminodeoxychorismate lyase [Bacillus sp. REN16]MCC3359093.1 aminodeoxychorismate lyase [Bacillus sp. REN16]